jgi:nicotinamide-nucleotide amidase
MNASLARRADQVLKEARARHLTLATVESCTAGSLGVLLADAPGATDVFHGGFIVYTKANKIHAVGVPAALRSSFRRQPRSRRSDGPWRYRSPSG